MSLPYKKPEPEQSNIFNYLMIIGFITTIILSAYIIAVRTNDDIEKRAEILDNNTNKKLDSSEPDNELDFMNDESTQYVTDLLDLKR